MPDKNKFKFILASSSPRRKELIGHLNIPFEIIPSYADEVSLSKTPQSFCQDISRLKGSDVYSKLKESYPHLVVVSSDTIVYLDGEILGKPKNSMDAENMLSKLSNKTHIVFTAVTVYLKSMDREHSFEFYQETKVSFGRITQDLMEQYLKTNESLDKAGAYGIQGGALSFIESIQGSYSNVVGFPLSDFYVMMEKEFSKFIGSDKTWTKYF